jgi:hypothetical protein
MGVTAIRLPDVDVSCTPGDTMTDVAAYWAFIRRRSFSSKGLRLFGRPENEMNRQPFHRDHGEEAAS